MQHHSLSITKHALVYLLKMLILALIVGIGSICSASAQENQNEISIETEIKNCLEKQIDSLCYERLSKLFIKYKNSDFEKAVKIGGSAIKLAEKENNTLELSIWYGHMSQLYMDYELYSLSLEYIKIAIENSVKGNRRFTWRLINIGNIYYAEEIYNKALKYYKEALVNFKKIQTKNDTKGVAVSYLNMAMVYDKLDAVDSSLYYYHSSMATCDLINDFFRKSNACINLSNLFLKINNYDSVEYYLRKAEEYNRLSAESDLLHLIHEKRGDLFAKQGKYNLALENYNISVTTAQSFNDTRNLIRIHDKKAKVYTLLGQIDEAIEQYKLSLKYAHKVNNIKRLVQINKLISESYYNKLNIDSAYHFLWEYANWKDSLDNLNLKVVIHRYEKENELQKINVLEKELAFERSGRQVYKYLIMGVLAIFLAAIAFLYYVVKSKKQLKEQNTKIIEQNSTISAQVEEITQQNHLLNTYKNDLEKIVEQKTRHLEKALKRAEESDLLKTAFLTNMSHEIRTPMNAVLGFGSLLSNGNLDEISRIKYTEVLIKSTEALHKVINNIIELSKIESGQINTNKTYFDINVLFQELMLLFSKQLFELNKKDVKIEFTNHLPNDKNMIVADRSIIKQVMINLIDNAIKFTRIGTILFGCKMITENSIEFFVKDTGTGILKKDFDTIFKRFRQLEIKEKYKNKGIGLGLPISKGLVDKLNGKLYVESKKDKGSKFYFTIPYEVHEHF